MSLRGCLGTKRHVALGKGGIPLVSSRARNGRDVGRKPRCFSIIRAVAKFHLTVTALAMIYIPSHSYTSASTNSNSGPRLVTRGESVPNVDRTRL